MVKEVINGTDWSAVAARSQAYLAMHQAGVGDKSVTEKARFLMTLGLSRADAAALLGTSEDSLRHLLLNATRKEAANPGKASVASKAAGV